MRDLDAVKDALKTLAKLLDDKWRERLVDVELMANQRQRDWSRGYVTRDAEMAEKHLFAIALYLGLDHKSLAPFITATACKR